MPGTSGLAIASMVLGITGLLVSWFSFGIPSILAVIFGHISISQTKRSGQAGHGMAVAGLATGYSAIGLFVVIMALLFSV